MPALRVVPLFAAAVLTVNAQTLPTPDQQQETLTLATSVRLALQRLSPAARASVSALLADSNAQQRAGRMGEARRKLAQAVTVLGGQTWDAGREFAWSLALRPDQTITESGRTVTLRLTQFYPAALPATMTMPHLRVTSAGGETKHFVVPSADLIDQPFGFEVTLSGVQPGPVKIRAELMDRGASIAAIESMLYVAPGILSRRADIERRLQRIQGHDSTKQSIRYPFLLADAVNGGQRHFDEGDFGIPFKPQPAPFDFVSALRRSDELLAALESGKDPLWRAKGDHQRHYWHAAANEPMPYRLYVPQKWDGKSKLPMVLVLHGATRDENFYFDRDGGILAKLAEEHGFLVVCPLGLRPTGGWGTSSMSPKPETVGAARLYQNELSEKDALQVLDLVNKEFPIDADRTYLFGHSMGGGGVWYFGQKFPARWAAIAASASGIAGVGPDDIPYNRLRGLPLMVIVGDKDPAATNVRITVRLAKQHGLDPSFLEVPGATHETIVALAEPKVFEFFEKHRRGSASGQQETSTNQR